MTPTEIQLDDLRLRAVGRLSEAQDLFSIIVLVPAALARIRTGQSVDVGIAVVELAAIALAVGAAARELRREGLQLHLVGALLQGILDRSILVRLARRTLKAMRPGGSREASKAMPAGGWGGVGDESERAETAGEETAGIDWISFLVGLVMLGEAAVRVVAGGKTFSPVLLAGMTGVILGLGNPWLERMRRRRRWIRLDDVGVRGRLSRLRRLEVRWNELAAVEVERSELRFLRVDGAVRNLRLGRYGNQDQVRAAVVRAAEAAGVPVR